MILFFGDTHGDLSHVLPTVKKHQPKAIIFLGDIEPSVSFELELSEVMALTDVWWIPGNHDVDSQDRYDNLFCSGLADKNLSGRVVNVHGYRIAGLGGVFRSDIWYPKPDTQITSTFSNYASYQAHIAYQLEHRKCSAKKADGLLLKHKGTIFYEDWYKLYGQSADILVVHEAPSCHRYGFAVLDDLAQSMGVKSVFHGHHHECKDYIDYFAQLGFNTRGVGLCDSFFLV